jgi:hypothetical protein
MRDLVQIACKVVVCVSIIFVPTVAFNAPALFNNSQSTGAIVSLGLAFAMFAIYHLTQREQVEQWRSGVFLMLLVVQGLAYIRFFSGESELKLRYFLLAFSCTLFMLAYRIWISRKDWWFFFAGLDLVRLSAILFLLCLQHLVRAGTFLTLGWVVLLVLIASPLILGLYDRRWICQTHGGKGLVGTCRWILGFVVANNLLAWFKMDMQGPGLGVAILAAILYAALLLPELRKELDSNLWVREISGVMGSVVASTLFSLLKDSDLWSNPLFVGNGGVGLVVATIIVATLPRQ